MCTRRYKGIMQNAVILALIVCIGYGFYMYSLLQGRKDQYKALSSQMQVTYEEKARLEKVIKKMKSDCQEEKEQKEELIQGMLVEHQDKYEIMMTANKKLEEEKLTLSEESKTLKMRYDSVVREHEKLKTKHQESLASFSKDINTAQEDLQNCQLRVKTCTREQANLEEQLQNARSNLEGQLQNLRVDHENVLKSLKIIPRDAVNFNHPALKDTSESSIQFINDLLGESQEKLVQLVKREDQQQPQQQQDIVPKPVKQIPDDRNSHEEKTFNQSNHKALNQKNLEEGEVVKENHEEADSMNPPVKAVSKEEINENRDHENDSHAMQLKDEIVHVENIQPAAMQPAEDNYEKTNDENTKNDFEPEKAPHNVEIRTADDPIEKKSEVKIRQQGLQPDDPSKDLGGPIGDEVVHDLGDKEADDADGIQELQPVQQDALYNDHEEKHLEPDNDEDIDAPEENDDLQIEDDENDIHKAIVHDEEDPDADGDEKDSVQVVLPPAARVSDEELEVAVHAPPGQDTVDTGDEMPNGNGIEVYEHDENYENRDSFNDEDNQDDHEDKPQNYYNEEESDEEKEKRNYRNSKREYLDGNYEALKEMQKKIGHGANL